MTILLFALFAMTGSSPQIAPDALCGVGAYEYCQIGCDDLGEFILTPYATHGAALGALADLSDHERISAFIVQTREPNAGYALIRRPIAGTAATPAPWHLEAFDNALDAAQRAEETGGAIYSTNDPVRGFVVAWYAHCAWQR